MKQKSTTPASDKYFSALRNLETKICNSIIGAMALLPKNRLERFDHAHVLNDMLIPKNSTMFMLSPSERLQNGVNTVHGVVLVKRNNWIIVGIVKPISTILDDVDLFYTGDLDVDLTTLNEALARLELILNNQ